MEEVTEVRGESVEKVDRCLLGVVTPPSVRWCRENGGSFKSHKRSD